MRTLLSALLYFFIAATANAQLVNPDPNFGATGLSYVYFPNQITSLNAPNVVTLDNKQILAGWFTTVRITNAPSRFQYKIVRMNENGGYDASFGTNGYATIDLGTSANGGTGTGKRLALQPDGKIVGTLTIYNQTLLATETLVFRLNSNGSVDSTFGTNGQAKRIFGNYFSYGTSILVQSDGKIVVGGSYYTGSDLGTVVWRLLSNGTPDNSFNGNSYRLIKLGGFNESAEEILQQPDGKLLIGTSCMFGNFDMVVIRLTTTGGFDNTFNGTGWRSVAFDVGDDDLEDILLQPDGKIVLAGWTIIGTNLVWGIARLNSTGAPDNSFDNDGKQTLHFGSPTNHGYSVVMQRDGKLIMGGESYQSGADFEIALARFNTNGSVDSTFHIFGRKVFNLSNGYDISSGLAIAKDGKLVVSSVVNSSPAVLRTTVATPTGPDCSTIKTQVTGQQFRITGLAEAPIATVQVLNSNWAPVFEQTYTGPPDTVTTAELPQGRYFVKVNFYNSNWTSICEKGEYYNIGPRAVLKMQNVTVSEDVFNAQIPVCIDSAISEDIIFYFQTRNGTAIAGADYDATDNYSNIPFGLTCRNISVHIINDNIAEPTETFTIYLKSATNGTIIDSIATVTILDNDSNTPPAPDCNAITITPSGSVLKLKGLTAPVVTVHVFNSNWATAYNQTFNHSPDSVSIPLPAGTYHVKINFYTAGWSPICEKIADAVIAAAAPCPADAICVTNACPQQTIDLNAVYSLPNLLEGAVITWHTGTPATAANKLTAAQAQNVSVSGDYYAAININGSECYSGTKRVVVTINSCATGSAVMSAAVSEASGNKVTIAPNPFANFIIVSINSAKNNKADLTLLDVSGRALMTKTVQLQKGSNRVSWDGLNKYPPGSYFVRIITSEGVENFQLVRQGK